MKNLYPLLSVLFLIYWGCEDKEEEPTLIGDWAFAFNLDSCIGNFYTGDVISFNKDATFLLSHASQGYVTNGTWSLSQDSLVMDYGYDYEEESELGCQFWDCQFDNTTLTLKPFPPLMGGDGDCGHYGGEWSSCISTFTKQ